ncbi:hypothetical protein VNO77_02816 [Canavalia gladiata]|uniref:Uncharacterized protein n=1 Tax=Canavalia gladiata TaxID=3824 RepID=A0AAN9R6F2_CANGL
MIVWGPKSESSVLTELQLHWLPPASEAVRVQNSHLKPIRGPDHLYRSYFTTFANLESLIARTPARINAPKPRTHDIDLLEEEELARLNKSENSRTPGKKETLLNQGRGLASAPMIMLLSVWRSYSLQGRKQSNPWNQARVDSGAFCYRERFVVITKKEKRESGRRNSHGYAVIGDDLSVFGGTDGTNPLKNLHILNTNSHTRIPPSIRGEGPEACEGHSAAVVGKRLLIFSGHGRSADKINEVCYNDLYILNTEIFVWNHATTSGTPPSPRGNHTYSSWKNKIIVMGGEDERDYYPLYDDLYMIDTETGVWANVTTTPDGSSARISVADDPLKPFMSGVLVFIGGCSRSLEALDDMYYLHTGKLNRDRRSYL